MKRVLHLIGLKHREFEQLFNRRRCERRILLGREWRQAVPGLGRDHDASAAARDDIAKFFQHQRRSVEIDLEDRFRRRLGRGNAGGMDDTGDLAKGPWLSQRELEPKRAMTHRLSQWSR